MMGSLYSARKSIPSKPGEADDKSNQDQASSSKKESLTKSVGADEPDDKQTTSAPDINSKGVTVKFADGRIVDPSNINFISCKSLLY